MKNVIIAGSTGMVGFLVLKECLESAEVKKVITIDRRPGNNKHEKISEIVHGNFLDYSSIINNFKNIDIAFYCIGVYTGAVSKEEFRKITVDYTRAFADIIKKHNPGASFVFLSGAGADRNEKSRMMFARDKGAAENYLLKLNFKSLQIFRPGYIYPVHPRKEPNFTYVISRKLYPVIKLLMPNGVIKSTELARAMFLMGIKETGINTYENKDIRKLLNI